eukprot:g26307.t1
MYVCSVDNVSSYPTPYDSEEDEDSDCPPPPPPSDLDQNKSTAMELLGSALTGNGDQKLILHHDSNTLHTQSGTRESRRASVTGPSGSPGAGKRRRSLSHAPKAANSTTNLLGSTGGGKVRDGGLCKAPQCHLDQCRQSDYCLLHAYLQSQSSRPVLDEREAQRQKIAFELVRSEHSYCKGLRRAVTGFVYRLRAVAKHGKSLMTPAQIKSIFGNLEKIKELSASMCESFTQVQEQGVLLEMVPFVIRHYTPQFECFQGYLENYDAAIKHLQHIREQSPELDVFLKIQEEGEGDTLSSFLILPIQRLPRYILLLQELLKVTGGVDGTESKAAKDIKEALEGVRGMAADINASLHAQQSAQIVQQIENMFDRDDRFQPLVTPARCLVKQGALRKKFSKHSKNILTAKEYQFFLFNDIIVYASTSTSWKAGSKPSSKATLQDYSC